MSCFSQCLHPSPLNYAARYRPYRFFVCLCFSSFGFIYFMTKNYKKYAKSLTVLLFSQMAHVMHQGILSYSYVWRTFVLGLPTITDSEVRGGGGEEEEDWRSWRCRRTGGRSGRRERRRRRKRRKLKRESIFLKKCIFSVPAPVFGQGWVGIYIYILFVVLFLIYPD